MVIHGSALLSMLTDLFESSWRNALPLTARRSVGGTTADDDELDITDRRLLSLLLAGHPMLRSAGSWI